jgi:ABC-type protease/lipase transport system fused ATPase/permease subunit
VLRILRQLLHRPAIRMDTMDERSLRNARFASFMANNNRRPVNTDRKDVLLALSRFMRLCLGAGVLGLVAWVALESARAIGVF